jgi:mediator of RNA polymerase II transcription subunit 18
MHELSLMAQVPSARHEQTLQVLAGLAGMQPQHVVERHLIFKPRRTPSMRATQVGASQGIQSQQSQALKGQLSGELFYLQLVGEVPYPSSAIGNGMRPDVNGTDDSQMADAVSCDATQYDSQKQSWSLRYSDLPEVPGKRPVTSRAISIVDIIDGDAMQFMDDFGYKSVISSLDSRHGRR